MLSIEQIKKLPEPQRTKYMKMKYASMLGMAINLAEDQEYTGPLFYKTSEKENKNKEEKTNKNGDKK